MIFKHGNAAKNPGCPGRPTFTMQSGHYERVRQALAEEIQIARN